MPGLGQRRAGWGDSGIKITTEIKQEGQWQHNRSCRAGERGQDHGPRQQRAMEKGQEQVQKVNHRGQVGCAVATQWTMQIGREA